MAKQPSMACTSPMLGTSDMPTTCTRISMRISNNNLSSMTCRNLCAGLLSALLLTLFSCTGERQSWAFVPTPKSNIAIIGNSFAEGLQRNNYFETLLHASFPDHDLRVRNLGWSADEVNLRPRPLNFGTLDDHLYQQEANVVFACFGMTESFKGMDSLGTFKHELHELLAGIQQQQYDGKSYPEVILVSPIAHEKLAAPLPDPREHNKAIKAYTRAMGEVAQKLGIRFIDLYTPTHKAMAA